MATSPSLDAVIIFSLLDGDVWAHWPGDGTSVNLEQHEGVTEMMRDFIAQCDLSERLASSRGNNS